jgi:hypothetical protein
LRWWIFYIGICIFTEENQFPTSFLLKEGHSGGSGRDFGRRMRGRGTSRMGRGRGRRCRRQGIRGYCFPYTKITSVN